MKNYVITGFSKSGVWCTVVIRTVKECVKQRATEKGIIKITNVQEENL